MKRDVMKILAVLLALAMVPALAACSKTDDQEGDEDREARDGLLVDKLDEQTGPSPEEDPYGYLTEMTESTMEELSARYQGSPLSAIAEVLAEQGSLTVATQVPEEGVGLSGTLSYDLTAPAARLEASVTFQGQELAAGAYMDGAFWGVSVPLLFGNETYYGFRPSGLYDQVSSSVLAEAMDPEALEAFRQIDELLEVLKSVPDFDPEAARAKYRDLAEQTIQSMDLTAARASGQEKEGWVITGEMDSDALADILGTLTDEFMSADIWDVMEDMAAAVGTEFDMDVTPEQIDAELQAIRESGASCRWQWYTLDERLVKAVITAVDPNGVENTVTVNFFDGNAVTVAMGTDGDGDQMVLSSAVSRKDGSYTHTVTLLPADGQQLDITAAWADSGLLTLTAAQAGYTVTFTTTLTVDEKGFTLTDIRGVSDTADEDLEIPLSLTYTPGGAVAAPEDRANFFELSEEEMVDLIMTVQEALA